jgi:hypothetical protein
MSFCVMSQTLHIFVNSLARAAARRASIYGRLAPDVRGRTAGGTDAGHARLLPPNVAFSSPGMARCHHAMSSLPVCLRDILRPGPVMLLRRRRPREGHLAVEPRGRLPPRGRDGLHQSATRPAP